MWRITYEDLVKSDPESVRRLARWRCIEGADTLDIDELRHVMNKLFRSEEKRQRYESRLRDPNRRY
jgi:hypothetical protein